MPSPRRPVARRKFNPKWRNASRAISFERKIPERMKVSQFEDVLRRQYPKLALSNRTLLAFCSRHEIGTKQGNNRILSRKDMIHLNRLAARTSDLFYSGDFLTAEELGAHPKVQMTKSGVHLRTKALSAWVKDSKTGERKLMPRHIPFIRVDKGTTLGAPSSARILFPKHVAREFASLRVPASPETIARREARQAGRRKTGRSLAQIQAEAAERRARIAEEQEAGRLAREAERAKQQSLKAEADSARKAEAKKKQREKAEKKKKKAKRKKPTGAGRQRKTRAATRTRPSSRAPAQTAPEAQPVPEPKPVAPAEPRMKPAEIPTQKQIGELKARERAATNVPALESLLTEVLALSKSVNELYENMALVPEVHRGRIIPAKASLDTLKVVLSSRLDIIRRNAKAAGERQGSEAVSWAPRKR